MEFPETVLTKGKKGKLEIRCLDHRGSYVMCKYVDPNSTNLSDTKRKLMLKDENGQVSEYFIIPLKDPRRALLVIPEANEKERQVWNVELRKAEEIW